MPLPGPIAGVHICGRPGHSGNTLHGAGCTTLSSQRQRADPFRGAPKYYAADLAGAMGWLERERGQEGMEWRRCGRCVREGRLPAGAR